jgi:alpha-tubulin suppressor-like RCC1 family protein
LVKRISQGAIPTTVKLVAVSTGGIAGASCAVGDDGRAYCWGSGYLGSLGDGNLAAHDSLVPVQVLQGEVPTGVKLLDVRCGTNQCAAIGSDRKVYGWGGNQDAAIGQAGAAAGSSAAPKLISRVSSS